LEISDKHPCPFPPGSPSPLFCFFAKSNAKCDHLILAWQNIYCIKFDWQFWGVHWLAHLLFHKNSTPASSEGKSIFSFFRIPLLSSWLSALESLLYLHDVIRDVISKQEAQFEKAKRKRKTRWRKTPAEEATPTHFWVGKFGGKPAGNKMEKSFVVQAIPIGNPVVFFYASTRRRTLRKSSLPPLISCRSVRNPISG